MLPASPGCLDFLYDIKSTLDAGGSDTAILVLAYSLAPEARYPAQLEEAVELLRYLVQDQKQDPSNVSSHAMPLTMLHYRADASC